MQFGMPFLLENSSIEDAARLGAELGLDFVELNMNFPLCGLERMSASQLLALHEKYRLFFTFHLHEEISPCTFSDGVRSAWLAEARDAVTLARQARIPTVNLHWPRGIYITLPDHVEYLFNRYREQYVQNTLAFRKICEEASRGQVRVCVENTERKWQSFQTDTIELLLESDVFGLTLDVGHEKVAGYGDDWFYAAHPGRLCHMHLHDARPNQCHMPLGAGELDIAALVRKADAAHARAVIEIKTVQALRDSVRYLRERGLYHD